MVQCVPCLTACLPVVRCRSLPQYQDASFDAILDKGTLDSLMCGAHAGDNTLQMMEECHRYTHAAGTGGGARGSWWHTHQRKLQGGCWGLSSCAVQAERGACDVKQERQQQQQQQQ
jgi:hypothetical protein